MECTSVILSNKLDFKWENEKSKNGTWVICLHDHCLSLVLWLRFWKKLSLKLVTLARDIYCYRSFWANFNIKYQYKSLFSIAEACFLMQNFASAPFSMQSRPPSIFLHFQVVLDTNYLELSEVIVRGKSFFFLITIFWNFCLFNQYLSICSSFV